jgi:hypothetical protein
MDVKQKFYFIIAKGKTDKETAMLSEISPYTVQNHAQLVLKDLLAKIGGAVKGSAFFFRFLPNSE